MAKGTYREALKIWTTYGRIQKQIEAGDYRARADRDDVSLTGTVDGKRWRIQLMLNPYDRHRPHVASENAVPWIDAWEVWTSGLFNDRCDEALAQAERKIGFEYRSIISLLGGGGELPQKVCEAVDRYDNRTAKIDR